MKVDTVKRVEREVTHKMRDERKIEALGFGISAHRGSRTARRLHTRLISQLHGKYSTNQEWEPLTHLEHWLRVIFLSAQVGEGL